MLRQPYVKHVIQDMPWIRTEIVWSVKQKLHLISDVPNSKMENAQNALSATILTRIEFANRFHHYVEITTLKTKYASPAIQDMSSIRTIFAFILHLQFQIQDVACFPMEFVWNALLDITLIRLMFVKWFHLFAKGLMLLDRFVMNATQDIVLIRQEFASKI